MDCDPLKELDRRLAAGESAESLDFLIEHFRAEQNFPLLFEARLMKKRLDLGLPLIQTEDSSEFPAAVRAEYDQGIMDAAREAGSLYLAQGNIERAWPYFRAIGEQTPIVEAIERFDANGADAAQTAQVIAIAFEEGLHPAKGLELILESQGMCRAITTFGMFQVQVEREKCIELLVRGVHEEIVRRLRSTIDAQEGDLPSLLASRDDLFGEYDSYVDTSHLSALVPYSIEVTSDHLLTLYSELCDYGTRLSAHFQPRSEPPFANFFADYGYYIQGLRGIRVEEAIAHLRTNVAAAGRELFGLSPAQVLVNFLVRLRRPSEALEVSLHYLDGAGSGPCPSAVQLCFLAGDFTRLRTLAGQRGDLLSYAAAGLSATRSSAETRNG